MNLLLLNNRKTIHEDLIWRTEPDGQSNYPKIIAVVELIHAPKEYQNGCEKKALEKKEKYQDVYIWDNTKLRYQQSGGNIEVLDRWNQRHM